VFLRLRVQSDARCGGDGASMRKILIGVGILLAAGIVITLLIPAFMRSRNSHPTPPQWKCISHLRLIEAAKNRYAIDYGATNGTQLNWDNLCYYMKDLTNKCFCPSAPSSMRSPTTYTMNPIGTPSVCKVVGAKYGHSLTNLGFR